MCHIPFVWNLTAPIFWVNDSPVNNLNNTSNPHLDGRKLLKKSRIQPVNYPSPSSTKSVPSERSETQQSGIRKLRLSRKPTTNVHSSRASSVARMQDQLSVQQVQTQLGARFTICTLASFFKSVGRTQRLKLQNVRNRRQQRVDSFAKAIVVNREPVTQLSLRLQKFSSTPSQHNPPKMRYY